MAEHAGKPKVRFAGFTETWEQRKLGEVAKLNNGKDYKHLGDGNIPVYGTGGYMLSVNQALSYKDDAIGIGRKGTIDKPYILKAPFWTVDTLFYSIPNDKTELNFLFATFQKVDWKAADESTGVPSLSKSTIENIITFFPSLPEQARIGAFFCHLDRLITLHQRKRGRLENIKKAMLEKMFPKNGADVPEVRFAGFTEAWEQRKLGEVAKLNNGKDYKHLGDGNIPVYGTGGYMLSVNQALSYKDDAIGIGRKGTIDKPYILKAPFWTVDTLFYSIPNDKTELNFLFATFQKVDWKAADESTGVPSLSKSTIENIITFFPSLPEQARIGAFFCHLDRLITLHQRKVALLQNIKKACLEKMFV